MLPTYHNYPYQDLHDLNLDWLIAKIKELTGEMDAFKVINTISFYGDWDITKGYPAWSIVSDPNNDGYISIKPVPPGVDIYNEDYWILVANYSALYADMQNRIIALENTVGDASSGLVKDVNDLQSDVSTLNTEMPKKANAVKKVLIIGDSYLDRVNSYGDYLASAFTDATFVLKGESGAGFTHYSTLGLRTFQGILELYAGSISDADKASFTDVVAIGGSNDRDSAKATIESAIASFYTSARTNFPNAKMHLGFLGWTGFSSVYQSADKLKFLGTKNYYEGCCYTNNLAWIENLNYLMHDYSNYADEGHPNDTLSERIGLFLYRYFKCGHADAYFDTNATFTLNTTNFGTNAFSKEIAYISASVRNGTTIFKVNGPKPGFNQYGKIQYTCTGLPGGTGNSIVLGDLSGGAWFGIEDNSSCHPIIKDLPITFFQGSNFYVLQIGVTVIHGQLILVLNNGAWSDFSAFEGMNMNSFEIVLDTDFA